MNINKTAIKAVPTNIITGFLGVGKTSMMLHLLKHKPEHERWAILVNEFGEIGVDGSLFEGQQDKDSGVYIREVPGGCMCCAAGVPMQVALNHLLKNANPDRLLIEPTGLGHPKEILTVLSSEHYQDVLALQKIITLVDARNLSDKRYTEHETFKQQIAIADTIVGNKSDLYKEDDKETLINYCKQFASSFSSVTFSQYGAIELDALEGATSHQLNTKSASEHAHHHHHSDKPLLSDIPLPDCGFIKAVNTGEGFTSIGWRFSEETIFDQNKISSFIWNTGAERVKTVFNTDKGMHSMNFAKDVLTEMALEYHDESRMEIIFKNEDKGLNESTLEAQLMECIRL